jgi:DNA polymerase-3 subunit epsilon
MAAAGPRPRVQPSAEELAAHEARLAKLRKKAGGTCLWDEPELIAAAVGM